jgi:hypothetical protein
MEPEFDRHQDLFRNFMYTIKHTNRFYFDMDYEFIDILQKLIDDRVKIINVDTTFYRARIGGIEEGNMGLIDPYQTIEEVGMPQSNIARLGRANPTGIPYLYLADDPSTAVAEVRPWVGSSVTIAKFILKENLSIVDLTQSVFHSIFESLSNGDLPTVIGMNELSNRISYELSKPINPNTLEIEYLPTQFLSEFIKNHNYDGIKYRSSLGDGNNLVLFTQDQVELHSTWLSEVLSISFQTT